VPKKNIKRTPRMSFRIATYNIHRCIGRDKVEDPTRIAAVLREIDPDVIALQEVAHQPGSPGNALELLAATIGAVAIEGTTLRKEQGSYGNALLTRVPVTAVHRENISVSKREPRGALDVTLTERRTSVRVVATHLGLRPAERRYQIRRILSLLESIPADVTVLLGDLNEWFLWGRPLRWLQRVFDPLPAPATFPSRRPWLALDRLWVRPHHKLISLGTHQSELARTASDHLPLVADLDL
jgi:endonuclease/exonuclease/phosphatase family metal-dependent hydrolase